MIRFILHRQSFDGSEFHQSDFETLDLEVPELEKALRRGGYGAGPNNDSYDKTVLFAAEVRNAEIPQRAECITRQGRTEPWKCPGAASEGESNGDPSKN